MMQLQCELAKAREEVEYFKKTSQTAGQQNGGVDIGSDDVVNQDKPTTTPPLKSSPQPQPQGQGQGQGQGGSSLSDARTLVAQLADLKIKSEEKDQLIMQLKSDLQKAKLQGYKVATPVDASETPSQDKTKIIFPPSKEQPTSVQVIFH